MKYKKITREELDVFLRKHKLWLANEPGGERADLREADLYGADLREADLREADLRGADLYGANLYGADLCEADLYGANLREAKDVNYPMACPECGSFTAWKKAANGYIVELLIPKDAKRSSATGRKCRCNKAKVVAIYYPDMTPAPIKSVKSNWDSDFIYKVGKTVKVSNFDEDRWNECAPGIHFFITKQEAIDY